MSEQNDLPSNIPSTANAIGQQSDHDRNNPTEIDPAESALLDTPGETINIDQAFPQSKQNQPDQTEPAFLTPDSITDIGTAAHVLESVADSTDYFSPVALRAFAVLKLDDAAGFEKCLATAQGNGVKGERLKRLDSSIKADAKALKKMRADQAQEQERKALARQEADNQLAESIYWYKPTEISPNGFVSHVAERTPCGTDYRDWEERLKDCVSAINQHHALTMIGNKTRVLRATASHTAKGHFDYDFIVPTEFTKLYSGRELIYTEDNDGRPVFGTYSKAWLENPRHAVYGDGVFFRPNQQLLATQFNLWQGFTVKPKKGIGSVAEALGHILWHIEQIICGGDPALIQYFYDWVAYAFQNPDKPAGAALVLRGLKGCGKGIIAKFLMYIWGVHGLKIESPDHLIGKHNKHLMHACFLFADEAFFSGDKKAEGRLKSFITEDFIMIEPKNIDATAQPNYLKIIMSTNNDWAVPASRDERRYCVFDVSSDRIKDRAYFNALRADIENPEVQAAFLYDMLHRDLSQYHSGNIPESKGLQDQRMHSLHSAGKWLLDSLHNGYFEARNKDNMPIIIEWTAVIPACDLFNSYLFWCDNQKIGEHHRRNQTTFGTYLGEVGFTRKTSNGIQRVLGTLQEATAKFENHERIKVN